MPRKTKVVEVEPEVEASEPEQETEAEGPQEIEETKPAIKPKRVLTEKQLENLKRAREAALLKKKELKELAQKAKALPKKEIELKAAEYDKLEEKKKQITNAFDDPLLTPEKIQTLSKELNDISQLIEEKELHWLSLNG